MASKEKFTVIVDTREQKPIEFVENDFCTGSVSEKVEHGDYSIKGLEDKIFIERKASVTEVAQNVVQKRFATLLDKSQDYKYKFLLCEFSIDDVMSYPFGQGLKPYIVKKIKLRGNFIMSKLLEYQMKYGIHVIFCNDQPSAKKYLDRLLKKIYEAES